MIALDQITFAYPGAEPLFQDFSWRVGRGEAWAVLGTSGCGKSTLLYLLAGLRLVQSGQVCIDGAPLTRPRPQTGLIIQDYGLLPWATVRQNVELGLRVRNFYGPDGTHAPRGYTPSLEVDPWLERLGIGGVAGQFPGQISGGQRQRTAIARTLALRPDLMLMDEPFSSLDAPTREALQTLTLTLCREQQLTVILVTHALEEAAFVGQRILLLGRPPHHVPCIIEAPHPHEAAYRHTPAYQALCAELRERLEAEECS